MGQNTKYECKSVLMKRPSGSRESLLFQMEFSPSDVLKDCTMPMTGRECKALAEYIQAARQDKHIIMIDYDSFVEVKRPNALGFLSIYEAKDLDFQLQLNSPAAGGCALSNVNDDFKGKATDLGRWR